MRVLVACEFSGVVRRALEAAGHEAWSCDVLTAEDGGARHLQCDALSILGDGWDAMVAHPPCTRLANSGVRWLSVPPAGRTVAEMWGELERACEFYRALRDAPIPVKAIENPVMHCHARKRLGIIRRQTVQPHWFGDPFFKATGFELVGMGELVRTHWMKLPEKGTHEHREWSAVHMASPGPERWKMRSRTHPGIARALALQISKCAS